MSKIEMIIKSLKWHLRNFNELKTSPADYLDKTAILNTIKYHQDMSVILQMVADQYFEKEKLNHPELILALKSLWAGHAESILKMKSIVDFLDLKIRVANYDNVIEVDFKNKLAKDRKI